MKKSDINEGQVFGDWTVIKFDKELGPYGKFKYFLCKCVCGNSCSVRGFDLLRNVSKSCGCGAVKKRKRHNLVGKVINDITVLEEISHKMWQVKCSCGKVFNAKSSSLSGTRPIQSCGCKTIKIIKSKNSSVNSYLTYLYGFYKNNAIKRNLYYRISLTHFEKLVKSNCYYCGLVPSNMFDGTSYSGKFLHNGVDRKNNFNGYDESNCVPCCKTCNIAKYTMSETEFYSWLSRITNFLKQDNRL